MDNGKFNIFDAARNAYIFVGREWLYLLKIGMLPMALQVGTALFLQFPRKDASQIEGALWGLPASVVFAWFMFLEIRLLLLGERLDQLPQEREARAIRQHAMKLSVLTSLLFNMGMTAAFALLVTLTQAGPWGVDWAVTLGGLFILGLIFWSLRFAIVPILAAVHYPSRPVLQQTWGMMFPLRLVGMAGVCLFPIALLLQIVLAAFVDPSADPAAALDLTAFQQMALIIAGAPISLLAAALLNAALAYALKQLLGSKPGGVLA